ncbi:LPS export ABC transporter permease LptG [Pleionea sp. CnH1-48]|uniref:LPS export ABC transporter permease LptG n=1 Tax=Pleionea sp. CnH1-48 TaxID=2954494 RepID=UPI0020981C38|nr:LPS export ABC transporter permease LptG [Pleionea sp. CnH1-48]MCO7225364.1 LPS export ABC transporter permease LptG [Pleionea sp. CnH1-48]
MNKLSILDKYIARNVITSVTFTLLILVGLRTLFSLLDETGDLGKGNYEFIDATYYVLLLIPARIYELFPMSVLIGGLSALGVMSSQSELTVMRAIGIKTQSIVGSTLKATLVLMFIIIIVGEFIAPVASREAQQLRAAEISGGHITQSKTGVWARSQNDILHIKRIVSSDELVGVTLFRLDNKARLLEMVSSPEAFFNQQTWVLQNAVSRKPGETEIEQQTHSVYMWEGELDPQHVDVLTVEPEMLNLAGLLEYQDYLENNQLDAGRYQLAFWRKVAQPIALIVMMVLASSFIFGPMRSVSMGARLMSGIVVGFAFHIASQFFGPISLVYNLPPFLGAMMPLLLFGGIAIFLLKRAS